MILKRLKSLAAKPTMGGSVLARLRKTFREEDHPRADDGRFGTGGGSAAAEKQDDTKGESPKADIKTTADLHAKADKIAEKAAGKLAKLGAAGKWAKDKAQAAFEKLEQRYGRKTALAIFAAGQVTSWGAMGAGAAAGVPVYVPSAVAMAPFAAMAEVYVQAKKMMGKSMGDELPLEEIMAEGERLFKELSEEWEAYQEGQKSSRFFRRLRKTLHKSNDEDQGDEGERINLIADVLYHVFGDDAVSLFDEGEKQKSWDEAQHPRGPNGRFIPRNSPEAASAAKAKVKETLKGPKTPETHKKLAEHLNLLSTKQLAELKKEYQISAAGRTKKELVEKLAERLGKGRVEGEQPEEPATGLPESPKDFGKEVQSIADDVERGYGDNKVFIADAYNAVKDRDPSLTMEAFKAKLLEAHQAGAIRLERADMVQAMASEDVRQSEISTGNADFHFILAAKKDREQTQPDRPQHEGKPQADDRAGRVRQGIAAPHEYTQAEWLERAGGEGMPQRLREAVIAEHKRKVEEAVAGGVDVPGEVRADYEGTDTAAIHERAASDPSLTYEDIDAHVQTLRGKSKEELLGIAKEVAAFATPKDSKGKIAEAIGEAIKARKTNVERTGRGGAGQIPQDPARSDQQLRELVGRSRQQYEFPKASTSLQSEAEPESVAPNATVEISRRAANDPTLTYAEIDAHVDSLKGKSREELLAIGVPATGRTKQEILESIRQSLKGRKENAERTGIREQTQEKLRGALGGKQSVDQAHQQYEAIANKINAGGTNVQGIRQQTAFLDKMSKQELVALADKLGRKYPGASKERLVSQLRGTLEDMQGTRDTERMIEDIPAHGGKPAAPPKESVTSAFDRLATKDNFVSLADLRAAVPDLPKADFDAAIQQLRREGVLSGSAIEGRVRDQRVMDAAIDDGGEKIGYVSRRNPGKNPSTPVDNSPKESTIVDSGKQTQSEGGKMEKENSVQMDEHKQRNRAPIGTQNLGKPGVLVAQGGTKEIREQLKRNGWKYDPGRQVWTRPLVAAYADIIRNGGERRMEFIRGLVPSLKNIQVLLDGEPAVTDRNYAANQTAIAGNLSRVRRTSNRESGLSVGMPLKDKDGSYNVVASVGKPRYNESSTMYETEFKTRAATAEEAKKFAANDKIATLVKELQMYSSSPDDERGTERHKQEAARVRIELQNAIKEAENVSVNVNDSVRNMAKG